MEDLVLTEVAADGVATVTLNLPTKRNALTLDLRDALVAALTGLDETCRAVVLTGAGGAFSAGGDLSSMRAGDPLGARRRLEAAHRIARLLALGPRPVVAAVEGAAFGAGFSLALLADHVVADATAKFCAPFNRVGLMPDFGMLWSLPLRIGLGRARDLMLLGDVIEAEEAARIGLVDRLVAPGAALAEARSRAARLAGGAPVATALTKAALARGLEAVLAEELTGQVLLMSTADHEEGRAAFFEKRTPRFVGR